MAGKRISWWLGALLAACILHAPSSRADDCTCKDRRDLLNRLREANAAIAAYEGEIARLDAEAAQPGNTTYWGHDVYQDVQRNAIQLAINSVTDRGALRVGGQTDGGDCVIRIDPKDINTGKPVTACMSHIIGQHEAWHKKGCDARHTLRPKKIDWRAGMTLAEVLRDEIQSYRAEINEVLLQLEQTVRSCGFVLELDSVIDSPAFGTRSEAHAKIPLAFDATCNCFTGSGQLQFDTGPNGASAIDMYYQGKGETSVQVTHAEIREDAKGRYVRMAFNVGWTNEVIMRRGVQMASPGRFMNPSRGVPVPGTGFWYPQFVISRGPNAATADGGYLVTGWTPHGPDDAVYADATLQGTNCSGNCTETTKLVLKQQ